MANDAARGDDSKFIPKLIRFRPDLWGRLQAYQKREFIKRDQDAVFALLDKALTAEGFPAPGENEGKGEKDPG